MKTETASALAAGEITTPLILDMLEWLAREPRSYAEVMDVWRTSCPRLTIWEEAVDHGLVVRRREPGAGPAMVEVTASGRQALVESRRAAA
ncbi:MAG TPA: hypothetical protein VHW60_20750 [Caulobacteraceae bacterium]|jgi:hypothetical protein|nr:hypothetical protein [Caulobacteraceae bacterium]